MPSALVIGHDPQAVPGVDGEALRAALDAELARFGAPGIDAAAAPAGYDEAAEPTVVAALTEPPWDVVAVGGGIREAGPLLLLFEQVVNLIRLHSPQVAIVFDTSIADSWAAPANSGGPTGGPAAGPTGERRAQHA
ncbi:hypothetical protein OHO28_18960 [Streptomyces europaeiscabiei]|uniref:hypothetical protein n=1 Tax=Streptomyces europaeiscabiei TaxID=146819 RepID=UPI002E178E98